MTSHTTIVNVNTGRREDGTYTLADIPKGKGLLYKADTDEIVDGPFNLRNLYQLLNCGRIQMVPCSIGPMANKAVLIMDEDGMYNQQQNPNATVKVGDQVSGGELYGNVLLLHREDFH